MIERTKKLEKLNISELEEMDEFSRQTLLRIACSIISSNKNNSITELRFGKNGGNAEEG